MAEDPHSDTVDHLSSYNLSIPVDPLVSIDPVEEAAKNSPESEPMLKALFQSFEQEKEVPIPQSALSLVWKNCVVNKNKRGASSIAHAAAQTLGLPENDFWKVKMEIHETIVRSFDSMKVYNIPLVEILALTNMMGANIHVLHKRGGDIVNLDNCWDWTTHPIFTPHLVQRKSKYFTEKDLYLITEDNVHFYLLSEASEAPDLEPHVNIPNVEREATDFDIINEAEEPIDIAGFNMVPVSRLAKATQPSTEETLPPANPSDEPDIGNVVGFSGAGIGHGTRNTSTTSSTSHISSSSIGSCASTVRRSTRISKKTERYELFQILQRPTASTERRERLEAKTMASFQRKRKLEDERNEIMNRNLDKAIENGRMIREKDKKEAKRLKEMGEQLRKGLSKENIKEIFHDNIEYFKNIELGKEDSWRFAKFKDASKEQELLFRQIGGPFSEEQQDIVHDEVKKLFLIPRGVLISRFVSVVITPEVFIRIYQIFFGLSKPEAEKNLDNSEGSYFSTGSTSSSTLFL